MVKVMTFEQLAAKPASPYRQFTRGDPQPLTKTDRSFKKMFKDLLDLKVKENKPYRVRPSRLPFCPWAAMLAELVGPDTTQEVVDFAGDFYRNVGRVAHSVIGKWLGKAGYLYGPYKCSACRKIVFSLGEPKECENECTFPDWEYLEIDLKDADPTGVFSSASADGLIRFDWMKPDHYYLVDFKTCSLNTLPRPEYGLTATWHKDYLQQTAIYVNLLGRFDDLTIDGTVIVFVPRDDPKQMTAVVIDQSETNGEIFWGVVKDKRAAVMAAKTGEASKIRRDCKTREDNVECPFNSVCFDRKATTKLFKQRNLLPILPDF